MLRVYANNTSKSADIWKLVIKIVFNMNKNEIIFSALLVSLFIRCNIFFVAEGPDFYSGSLTVGLCRKQFMKAKNKVRKTEGSHFLFSVNEFTTKLTAAVLIIQCFL